MAWPDFKSQCGGVFITALDMLEFIQDYAGQPPPPSRKNWPEVVAKAEECKLPSPPNGNLEVTRHQKICSAYTKCQNGTNDRLSVLNDLEQGTGGGAKGKVGGGGKGIGGGGQER
jgi:hypothetical protein